MIRKTLFLAILIIAFALQANAEIECHPITYADHGEIDGELHIALITMCDEYAIPNVLVSMFDGDEFVKEFRTNENAEYYMTATTADVYFFEGDFEPEFEVNGKVFVPTRDSADYKLYYNKEPRITVSRRTNTYTICSNEEIGSFTIKDGDRHIILKQEDNCARHSTESEKFLIETSRTGFLNESKTEAGSFIKAVYPNQVIKGKSFTITAYDNSIPLRGAEIEIGGRKRTTDSEGKAPFILNDKGEQEIKITHRALEEYKGTIKVVEQFDRLQVTHPTQVKPLKVFEVLAMNEQKPVEGAIVSLNGRKKVTGSEGTVKFAVAEEGTHTIEVEKEGFEKYARSVRVFLEKEPEPEEMTISAPEKAFEGKEININVYSGTKRIHGAKITINEKETETDSAGEAIIAGLSPGKYTIKAEKQGYLETETEIIVKEIPRPAEPETMPEEIFLIAIGIAVLVMAIGIIKFWRKRRLRN